MFSVSNRFLFRLIGSVPVDRLFRLTPIRNRFLMGCLICNRLFWCCSEKIKAGQLQEAFLRGVISTTHHTRRLRTGVESIHGRGVVAEV